MAVKTPKLLDKLLALFLKEDLLEEVLGDLYQFHQELERLPRWKRVPIYWYQAISLIRPNLMKSLSGKSHLNYFGMFKLQFKLSIRSFFKQPGVTIPSLLTLIFGVLCCQLIYSWLDNELRMNDFHSRWDQIYVGAVQTNPMADKNALSPSLLFRLDYTQFPEVKDELLIHIYGSNEISVEAGGRQFGGQGLVADSSFFHFFDFPIRLGNEKHLLSDPSHIVLSANFANLLFGEANPIGKTVKVSCDQEGLYKVAAVADAIPSNSSIDFDFVIPRHSQRFWRRIPVDLVLTTDDFNEADLNKKATKMGRENNERFPESIISFLPIESMYFDPPMKVGLFSKTGNYQTVQTFILITLIIGLVTFLGFNSLQTTRQYTSVRKMGIKQMVGGSKASLCSEMIFERLLYLLVATVLGYFLFQAIFPYYKTSIGLNLSVPATTSFIGILSITSIIIFASVIISMIQIYAIDVKKAIFGNLNLFRIPQLQRAIVIIQYTVTIVLLIATVVVIKQFKYMTDKDPGFSHQDIVSVNFFEISNDTSQMKRVAYVKDQLSANPNVVAFAQGDMPVSGNSFLSSWKRTGGLYEYTSNHVMIVDPGYDELLGITVVEGRFFSDSLDQPGQTKIVINEAARKYWGIDDYTKVKLSSNTSSREEMNFEIIGIVKDFNYDHLSQKIEPLVLRYRPYADDEFLVRFSNGGLTEGLVFLENLFNEVNPKHRFDYELLEDKLARQYEKERRQSRIYASFTVIALILSSISLFTFSLYEVNRRTKELAIRKVNGATAQHIFGLLCGHFLRSILIAFFIAIPFAWYLTNEWLQSFAYRIQVGWPIFVMAGLVVALLALLATIQNVMGVTRQNPIDSLRYE